jgi:hypothetical protein
MFDYKVFPLLRVVELFSARVGLPDAYLAQDDETTAIQYALKEGYRWVRSDGEHAIFEKGVIIR